MQSLAESAAAGDPIDEMKLDAYVAPLSAAQNADALALARSLRAEGLRVEVGDGSFRVEKSFKTAERLAYHIVILGEDEVRDGVATVKTFHDAYPWKVVPKDLAHVLSMDGLLRAARLEQKQSGLSSHEIFVDRRDEVFSEARKDANHDAEVHLERLVRQRSATEQTK